MKKGKLLNTQLSWLLADLGHKDQIVIADAGLPVPEGVTKIDLAITCGLPGFISTLEVILAEMIIEEALLADEIRDNNPGNLQEVEWLLPESVQPEFVSHETFKERIKSGRAVIRTGECSPYSNIILTAGVSF
ncbi:MAG: D-ribose pyranase [Bacillota bacterium]